MTTVYFAMGGNQGPVVLAMQHALHQLQEDISCRLEAVSRLFLTSPVGVCDGPFLNAAARMTTGLTPSQLLHRFIGIERQLGKFPKPSSGSRPIDLDILFFGNHWVEEEDLQIPHPRWQERLFVLAPLGDLTDRIFVPGPSGGATVVLSEALRAFGNPHRETVLPMAERLRPTAALASSPTL